MVKKYEVVVNKNDAGQSIFAFTKKYMRDVPLSVIYQLFRKKDILINGIKTNDRKIVINQGDVITLYVAAKFCFNKRRTKYYYQGDLKIIYEDDNILVVDKDHNINMHSNIQPEKTLDYKVRSYLQEVKGYDLNDENTFQVSHIHRLDKLTRGIVIYTKNKISLNYFLSIIKDHLKMTKKYLCLVSGQAVYRNKLIKGWIYKSEELKRMVFSCEKNSNLDKKNIYKYVETEINTIKFNEISNTTWLEIKLLTGRKHQIRATLKYLKHPIINDFKYGSKTNMPEKKIWLFAYLITLEKLSAPFLYLNNKQFIIDNMENIIKKEGI